MEAGTDYIGIVTPFYCHDGDGNFLFNRRSGEARDEEGRWDPGSGKLEHGETLEECVKREVKEEYGCDCTVEERLPPHGIFREQDGVETHWLAIPFFVHVDPDEVCNNEPEKFEEIGWFSLDEVPEPLHTGFAHTVQEYRSYFEEYEN